MFRLLDVRTINVAHYKLFGLERPGFHVKVRWSRGGQPSQKLYRRFNRQVFFHVGEFELELYYLPSRFWKPAVTCAVCGRLQPKESQMPYPGSPEWQDRTYVYDGGWSGLWERDVKRVNPDGSLVYKPWKWVGPCCDTRHSGYYDDDIDEEEDWYDDFVDYDYEPDFYDEEEDYEEVEE